MSIERRVCTRKTPKHLGYLSLPFNNGGIVLDVSEGGLGFRSIAPVIADGPIHFRFAIDSGKRIKAVGELAWKDNTGKIGGLRFTQLSDEIREQIRVWANQTDVVASAVVNAEAKARVLNVQVAEPAIEVEGAPRGDADLPPGEAASHPLLYNLKPPIYSAPFNNLSMFPLEQVSGAAAAAVLPQFIQVLDEIREQVRDWAAQSNAGVYDNPFGDPAFDAEVAPRSGTELALAENIPVAESEYASRGKTYVTPSVDGLAAVPVIEADVTTGSESDLDRIVAAGNPLLYNLKPPVYSAPFSGLSMFPLELESEAVAADLAVPESGPTLRPLAALQRVTVRHPIAAIGMTIVLAFVVSVAIIAYAATSPAGKRLFDWGAEMWGGFNSQPAPQNTAPSLSRSQDSSMKPRQ